MDLTNVRSCCRLDFWGVMHFQPWPQVRNSQGALKLGRLSEMLQLGDCAFVLLHQLARVRLPWEGDMSLD